MSRDVFAAQKVVGGTVHKDPKLLEKIKADHEARARVQDAPVIPIESALPAAIRDVMLDRQLPSFDKRRHVTALVRSELECLGEFFRTQDGRLFFFLKSERRLHDLEQKPIQHLLTEIFGLSATETGFRFVLDILQSHTARKAPMVDVHTLAYYSPETGLLAISDGDGGVWFREPGGQWEFTHNGDNGLLFLTEPEATSWVPDFGGSGGSLKWFLSRAMLASEPLTRNEQQTLFYLNLLHQFVPPLRRTRMIPAFLGPQGSGKTTALRLTGRLLLGPGFEVTGLHRDREDAFVAAVTNRTVCGLDNADSRIPWLEDALATYATGLRYRLRRLYTTNEEVSFVPRAVLMISSRDPRFNRPDVAERLLPLYFERPERYQAEGEIFRELESRRGAIWGELLTRLGEIADGLAKTTAPALPFRMADFAAFGWRVFAPLGRTAEWEALLARLEKAQAGFASEGDGVIEAFRGVLEQKGSVGPTKVGDLFKECAAIAEAEGLSFPRTANGFGRKLTNLRRVIELELGVRYREGRGHAGKRWVSLSAKPGDGGDDGVDFGEKV